MVRARVVKVLRWLEKDEINELDEDGLQSSSYNDA